jgi:D-glycero-D-manno-heptose 1,7-bisphosphate phosphatase
VRWFVLIEAVLLDRDGVLNVDYHYVCTPERFEWMPDAPEAVRWLNEQGILVLIVTNQSGIGRGVFSQEDFDRFTDWMQAELAKRGAHIDAVYVCPHHPTEAQAPFRIDCDCRKPRPGLVLAALREHELTPDGVLMIGDRRRDVEAAERAGVRGALYEGGSLLEFVQRVVAAVGDGVK